MRLDPLSVYSSLRERFEGESFLLESVEGSKKTARYSFIGLDPIRVFRSRGNTVEYDGVTERVENPFNALRSYFKSIRCGTSELAPFSGGMVGYVGYGMVQYFDGIRQQATVDSTQPDMYFVLPRHLVCIDHLNSRTLLISHGRISDLKGAISAAKPSSPSEVSVGEARPTTSKDEFERMVSTAKDHIGAGDIFQVVLSRRTDFRVRGDPLEIYRVLRRVNPSPYMFYLDLGQHQLLGSSPEMLVRLEGTRLTTRPLAGTRPRAADPEEDEKLKMDMLLDGRST